MNHGPLVMSSLLEPRYSRPIGIITGSGPEAGLDLCSKIIAETRRQIGAAFRGDLDVPQMSMLSLPVLGLSMELDRNWDRVERELVRAAQRLSHDVSLYAVACNTLNVFADTLRKHSTATLVSYSECVGEYLTQNGIKKVALLGAKPILTMDKQSTYFSLTNQVEFEVPEDIGDCQRLMYAVKRVGRNWESRNAEWYAWLQKILEGLSAEVVLLACTEMSALGLPAVMAGKRLIDASQLVAEKLVTLSLAD